MNKLTHKEEEVMQVLWTLKRAYVKDVRAAMPLPKPHYNTLSTIIRKLEKKGFLSHQAFGNTHQYFPIIERDVFLKRNLQNTINNYFNDSYKNVVSFFAREEKISVEELKEIIALIEKK